MVGWSELYGRVERAAWYGGLLKTCLNFGLFTSTSIINLLYLMKN